MAGPRSLLLLVLVPLLSSAAGSRGATAEDVAARGVREAIELHDFLAAWFAGRLPSTDAAFARFDGALAADFELVDPDGSSASRAAIVAAVRGDWGRWQGDAGAGIEVKNARSRTVGAELSVVTYEEWQTTAEGVVVRLSTVVFREHPEAPLGLQWVHLHETWMPVE